MIRLRPFKPDDAEIICQWLDDEELFQKWCAGHYDFPLTARQLIIRNEEFQKEADQFFMTALNENGNVCGHFIFRKADYKENSVHMGFIVVSPQYRGKGIGSQMMKQAVAYAREILGMKRITLGVFENNPPAMHCYESAGFIVESKDENCFEYKGEKWNCCNMVREE